MVGVRETEVRGDTGQLGPRSPHNPGTGAEQSTEPHPGATRSEEASGACISSKSPSDTGAAGPRPTFQNHWVCPTSLNFCDSSSPRHLRVNTVHHSHYHPGKSLANKPPWETPERGDWAPFLKPDAILPNSLGFPQPSSIAPPWSFESNLLEGNLWLFSLRERSGAWKGAGAPFPGGGGGAGPF